MRAVQCGAVQCSTHHFRGIKDAVVVFVEGIHNVIRLFLSLGKHWHCGAIHAHWRIFCEPAHHTVDPVHLRSLIRRVNLLRLHDSPRKRVFLLFLILAVSCC